MDTLLAPTCAAARRRLVRPDTAWAEMPPAGHVPGVGGVHGSAAPLPSANAEPSPALPGDTSSVAVVDRHGNAMSATPSDTSWESPIIPGLGFCPSSRGSQSWAVPGHASCVAPGKRPRLTPNPAMALRRGRWVMPFGAPGGDLQ